MDIRIISVIQKIISDPAGIENPYKSDQEYYFQYKKKAFSLLYGPSRSASYGPYTLYVYPKWGGESFEQLARETTSSPVDDDYMVPFHSAQFPTPEAQEAFSTLYVLLQKKYLNMDKFYDDILNS